jgi:hypothetical protein
MGATLCVASVAGLNARHGSRRSFPRLFKDVKATLKGPCFHAR